MVLQLVQQCQGVGEVNMHHLSLNIITGTLASELSAAGDEGAQASQQCIVTYVITA
jgi:hypothetical protein